MGRCWVVVLIKISITYLFFTNLLIGQTKPVFEKYGDSLSVFLFQEIDVLKATHFINRIDKKIKEGSIEGLGVYYYYKSIYFKQLGDNEYKKFLLLSLKELKKSNNYFVYEILVNEQLSRIYRHSKNFQKELIYLSEAFDLIKKYKEDVPLTISDVVVRSYFFSLVENNKINEAIQNAEWIDKLSTNDTTKINSYLNVAYLFSQKGSIREEKLIYKKVFKLIDGQQNLNQFFISVVNMYAHSLKQTGFEKEGENLLSESINKIENEFDDEEKIDFYLRYAFFLSNNKIKLKKIINILEQQRFEELIQSNESFLDRYYEFKSILNQSDNLNKSSDIERHEKATDSILRLKINETKLIYHYSHLSILYDEINDKVKSKTKLDKLKSIFSRNKKNLNQTDLSYFRRSAIYFDDIELALESWKLTLDWINNSICSNYGFTNEEFNSFYEMPRIIVFHATSFNLEHGNFPELQKKIIIFHELLKQRINQEIEFINKLKLYESIPKYHNKFNEYISLNNSLVLNSKDKEKLLYLRRYFSELINPSTDKNCENLDVDDYREKNRSILYYTSIKAGGAEFYRLYTLNDKSNFNPLKFYFALDNKPKRTLNDDFTKSQIKNLENLNLLGSDEILISRTADINFINFSAYKKEIDILTGTDTKIRLINSLGEIDSLSDEMFAQKTEIILYGDIDYDNFDGDIPESSGNKNNSSMITNLSRSSLSSWSYLPGTLKEINSINGLAKRKNLKSNIISGTIASEISFRSLSEKKNPFILHLATHGFFFNKVNDKSLPNSYFSNDDPLIRSGIVLAGANRIWDKNSNELSRNDGVLTSKEIANLDFKNCKLLVLSACDTGLGEFGADSVEGVQKALKIAGVDKIIMSLSKIPDDKTPIFFECFYSELFKGLTIHTAFSNTQKEMRKRYGFEDDFWTSFILLE
jgi:hypothetical protein